MQTNARRSEHITWLCARDGSLLGNWQDKLGETERKKGEKKYSRVRHYEPPTGEHLQFCQLQWPFEKGSECEQKEYTGT